MTRLLEARGSHGRGNYAERWDGTDGLFAFERGGSALVLLSNRGDAGFDSRTLTNVGDILPWGELSYIGTTDTDTAEAPDQLTVSADDVSDVVTVIAEALKDTRDRIFR